MGSVEQELHTNPRRVWGDWRFYKHPLPEHVFEVYMHYWKDVEFVR